MDWASNSLTFMRATFSPRSDSRNGVLFCVALTPELASYARAQARRQKHVQKVLPLVSIVPLSSSEGTIQCRSVDALTPGTDRRRRYWTNHAQHDPASRGPGLLPLTRPTVV